MHDIHYYEMRVSFMGQLHHTMSYQTLMPHSISSDATAATMIQSVVVNMNVTVLLTAASQYAKCLPTDKTSIIQVIITNKLPGADY